MNLRLLWLKYRAAAMRQDILLAHDRRHDAMVASDQLYAWIRGAQARLDQMNAKIAAAQTPGELIKEAMR